MRLRLLAAKLSLTRRDEEGERGGGDLFMSSGTDEAAEAQRERSSFFTVKGQDKSQAEWL